MENCGVVHTMYPRLVLNSWAQGSSNLGLWNSCDYKMFSVAFTKKALLPDKRLGVAHVIIKALWTVTTDRHKHTHFRLWTTNKKGCLNGEPVPEGQSLSTVDEVNIPTSPV